MISLIFDTETTGLLLHPNAKPELQPQIIEWGGLLVNEKGEELAELDILINPGCPLPKRIIEITGITDGELVDKHSFKEAYRPIKKLFAAADVLIAHNLPFDTGMMKNELRRAGLLDDWPWPRLNICTVQEHAEEWGYRPKLTELYQHYMKKPLAQTHRALDDVRALKEICIAGRILK